jgi:transposase
MAGKYRYIYLTKAANRSKADTRHIDMVMKKNQRIAKLEMIKEHFHKMFEQADELSAQVMVLECLEWSMQTGSLSLQKYFQALRDRNELWNYFKHRITSGVSEGINRAIKTLKWQAYGYKDMAYFALKIMQKCGYLNSKYALSWLYTQNT